MARVLVSNLAPIGDIEEEFFLQLMQAFSEHGHKSWLWSAVPRRRLGDRLVRMDWRLKEWPRHMKWDGEPNPDLTSLVDREKWLQRIKMLSKQDVDRAQTDHLLSLLIRYSALLLERYEPDLFLAWNTFCPHVGVAAEMCRSLSIPTLLIERAFLPHTWFVEPGGLVGHSWMVNVPLEDLVRPASIDHYAAIGERYLASEPFGGFERYKQNRSTAAQEELERLYREGPFEFRIAFFPPDDTSLGFFPSDTVDRRKHVPAHASSFDAAIALACKCPEALVVFKPHPSFGELALTKRQRPKNLLILDLDFEWLMRWTDATATTGSGLAFRALAMEKPVVSLGRDQLTGKQITYDAVAQPNIRESAISAIEKRGFEERLHRYRAMVGVSRERFLVGVAGDAGRYRASELLQDIDNYVLGRRVWKQPEVPSSFAFGSRSDRHQQEDGSLSWLAGVDVEQKRVLLDFDYTLFLSNSTEHYLESAYPQWLAALISLGAKRLRPRRLIGHSRGESASFDLLRVLLITLLMPWTWLVWRLRAKHLVRRLENRALIEDLHDKGVNEVDVVTAGFGTVVRPLLKHMSIGVRKLVSASLMPRRNDPRRSGKWRALSEEAYAANTDDVVFVTDSPDDSELLQKLKYGLFFRWPFTEFKALTRAYFPFRYTSEGKYEGKGVVRRHRFSEDLIVLLFAFGFVDAGVALFGNGPGHAGLNGYDLLSLFLLFLSFNCVYEIGYHENDFGAGRTEPHPNVSEAAKRFAEYPIRSVAWIWGLGFGAAGCGSLAYGARGWSRWLNEVTGSATTDVGFTAVVSLLVWVTILAGVRSLFWLHNTIPVSRRIYTFGFLHVAKLVVFALFWPLQLVGVPLLVAQVMRHLTNYLFYRRTGAMSGLNLQAHRLQVFAIVALVVAVATPARIVANPVVWFAAAMWCGWKAVSELVRRSMRQNLRLLKWRMHGGGRSFGWRRVPARRTDGDACTHLRVKGPDGELWLNVPLAETRNGGVAGLRGVPDATFDVYTRTDLPRRAKQPILILFPYPLLPMDNGGGARAASLLSEMRRHGHYVFAVVSGMDPRHVRDALRYADALLVTPGCHDLLSCPPEFVDGNLWQKYDQSLEVVVPALCDLFDFTAVIGEFAWSGFSLRHVPSGVLTILDTHDIQHSRADTAKAAGGELEDRRCSAQEEIATMQYADLVVAIQPDEERTLSRLLPDKAVISIGHAVRLRRPTLDPSGSPVLFYVGNQYDPNTRGLTRFLQADWPSIRAAFPNCELHVAGRVSACVPPDTAGVSALGFVEDVGRHYEDASIVINPCLYGTGLKIKTVEALGHGKCVVSSKSGVLGLPDPFPGVVAEPGHMADPIVSLLRAPDSRREIQREAFAYARENFSAENVYAPLLQRIQESTPRRSCAKGRRRATVREAKDRPYGFF